MIEKKPISKDKMEVLQALGKELGALSRLHDEIIALREQLTGPVARMEKKIYLALDYLLCNQILPEIYEDTDMTKEVEDG